MTHWSKKIVYEIKNAKPFRSIGSFGKLCKSLSNLISSLLVSDEYLSSLVFLISLKSFVWDFIAPKIESSKQ